MKRMLGRLAETDCCGLASCALPAVIAALTTRNSRRVSMASPMALVPQHGDTRGRGDDGVPRCTGRTRSGRPLVQRPREILLRSARALATHGVLVSPYVSPRCAPRNALWGARSLFEDLIRLREQRRW